MAHAPTLPPAETPPGFVVFTLTDADGAAHRYEVMPHPATEGVAVMLALVALGAAPFAGVIESALAVEDLFAGVGSALDLDLESLIGKIAWSKVAEDIKGSIQTMPAGLVRDVLRHTWRDGRELVNDVHYNAAFTRNYLELSRAVWEVAQANRFFPDFSTSKEATKE